MTAPESKLVFIHRFIPPSSPKDHRTLILLHDTGGDENDLLSLGRELASTAALLSPRGKVLESGMPRFFRRNANGAFDIPDLLRQTHELAEFVRVAAQNYGFDARRMIAVGLSNGANIAGSLLLLHAELLMGGILFRPTVPFMPEQLPDLKGIPVMISAGRKDPFVAWRETEQLSLLLKDAGAKVTLNWEDTDHSLVPREVKRAKECLSQLSLSDPVGV